LEGADRRLKVFGRHDDILPPVGLLLHNARPPGQSINSRRNPRSRPSVP
jgi:hypothetical protein